MLVTQTGIVVFSLGIFTAATAKPVRRMNSGVGSTIPSKEFSSIPSIRADRNVSWPGCITFVAVSCTLQILAVVTDVLWIVGWALVICIPSILTVPPLQSMTAPS